jgi:hypothetical protein
MATRATAVINAVRERVRRHISVPVSDAEALKICFLCSTVESDALLELSHARVVRAEACAHCDALALSHDEFDAVFDEESLSQSRRFSLTTALAEDESDPERQRQRAAIEAALKLTLAEKQQRDLWESSPRVRTRVTLATLRKDDHVRCVKHALGEVLGSDLRRIDDLRCSTEEVGIDIMSVAALITTVCSQIAG